MAKYVVDTTHSSVGFQAKHMMISKVKGHFDNFSADLDINPEDLTGGNIRFEVELTSINTNNEERDNHLRSADFFDVENYPTMTFVATDIKKVDDDEYKLTGDLSIRGVTKSVTFEAEYNGKGTNPWGVEVVAFEADGKINRKEFGLNWNAALETGGVLVSDEIKIHIEIEANPA